MSHKDLKIALYNQFPKTTQPTKTLLQNNTQDLTLNPVYRGPVYDPVGVRRKVLNQKAENIRKYTKAYNGLTKEQAASSSIKLPVKPHMFMETGVSAATSTQVSPSSPI